MSMFRRNKMYISKVIYTLSGLHLFQYSYCILLYLMQIKFSLLLLPHLISHPFSSPMIEMSGRQPSAYKIHHSQGLNSILTCLTIFYNSFAYFSSHFSRSSPFLFFFPLSAEKMGPPPLKVKVKVNYDVTLRSSMA